MDKIITTRCLHPFDQDMYDLGVAFAQMCKELDSTIEFFGEPWKLIDKVRFEADCTLSYPEPQDCAYMSWYAGILGISNPQKGKYDQYGRPWFGRTMRLKGKMDKYYEVNEERKQRRLEEKLIREDAARWKRDFNAYLFNSFVEYDGDVLEEGEVPYEYYCTQGGQLVKGISRRTIDVRW